MCIHIQSSAPKLVLTLWVPAGKLYLIFKHPPSSLPATTFRECHICIWPSEGCLPVSTPWIFLQIGHVDDVLSQWSMHHVQNVCAQGKDLGIFFASRQIVQGSACPVVAVCDIALGLFSTMDLSKATFSPTHSEMDLMTSQSWWTMWISRTDLVGLLA